MKAGIRWIVGTFALTILLALIACCAGLQENTVAGSLRSAGWAPYTIHPGFTPKQREAIKHATAYFSSSVGCINLVDITNLGVSQFTGPTLHFVPMLEKDGKFIGKFNHDRQEIALFVDEPLEMFYKCTLHELAHASGMTDHAFDRSLRNTSQLTPTISKKSKPIFYQRDVSYLKRIICGAPK